MSKGKEVINESLKPLVVDIDTLKEDPKNARKHNDRNINAIRASLVHNGQQKPIIATKAGIVIAGNGTLRAAIAEGWKKIAVVIFDGPADKARKYAVEDNQSGALAEWDWEVLADFFHEVGKDEAMTLGWEDFEIDPLLKADWHPDTSAGEGGGDHDDGADMVSIKLTSDQNEIVQQAIGKVRQAEGDDKMTQGRALELICADYLGGK